MENVKLCFGILIMLLTTSCITVDYVGQSYEETEQVDLYFDEQDIDEDYEIIGQAIAEGGRIKRIQQKLINKAKDEGADAIIIGGVSRGRFYNTSGNLQLQKQIYASFLKYK